MRIRVTPPSCTGGARGRSADQRGAGAVRRRLRVGMTGATPTVTELLEGYDRMRLRREEQIGSGMPLSIPEVRDLWYEAEKCGWPGELFVTHWCFNLSVRSDLPARSSQTSTTPTFVLSAQRSTRSGSRAMQQRRPVV